MGKQRLTQEQAESQIAAFSCHADIAAAASAQLFIEAVFEDIAVKRRVFDAFTRPHAP